MPNSRPLATTTVALVAAIMIFGGPNARAYDSPAFPHQEPDDYKFSISVGPSLLAPRMHAFDSALLMEGLGFIEMTMNTYNASSANRPKLAGFPSTGMGYGGQIHLQYEFDEDLRGGLHITIGNVSASGQNMYTEASLVMTPQMSGTTFIQMIPTGAVTATKYIPSHTSAMSTIELGLSLQKVFRFENTPKLKLYAGAWGSLGMLLAASFKGSVAQETLSGAMIETRDFTSTLRGTGWGLGGLGGIEYQLSRWMHIFGEGGFQRFIIRDIEQSGIVNGVPTGARSFTTGRGAPIDLDFTGVFFRIGVKAGLGG